MMGAEFAVSQLKQTSVTIVQQYSDMFRLNAVDLFGTTGKKAKTMLSVEKKVMITIF